MKNPLDPELMSAKERIEEVACLLARGFLRYWLRKAADGRSQDVRRRPMHVEPTTEVSK
jgi:hypothetical protein